MVTMAAGLVAAVAAPEPGTIPRPGPQMTMAAATGPIPATAAVVAADAAPKAPPAVKVMPLGDSITWGVGSQAIRPSSYRADLHSRLTRAGLAVDFVGTISHGAAGTDTDHEGHPGWTIAQITARFDGWFTAHRPDVVLLHIGTNDVKDAASAAGAPTRLAALIDRIRTRAPAAQIFVAKIIGSTNPRVQARVDRFNAAIPYIVSRRGPRVHLVNQSTIGGLDLRDWIHPNDFGYAKMSFNWYQAMRTVFQPRGRVWPAGVNPYAATRAYLCINNPPTGAGTPTCRWRQLRNAAQK